MSMYQANTCLKQPLFGFPQMLAIHIFYCNEWTASCENASPGIANSDSPRSACESGPLLPANGIIGYYRMYVQSNFNSSNTDGSFTMANSNSVLSPYEILTIAQENKYLAIFFLFCQ